MKTTEKRIQPNDQPVHIADVLKSEYDQMACVERSTSDNASENTLSSTLKALYDARLSALCLSGGGIRSATFALGIIQTLARHRLLSKIDYLSTVSGGGYIGSWLSAWIRTEQVNAFERAAVSVIEDGISNAEAIAKHFSWNGREEDSYSFLKYQEHKYGMTPELRRKADKSQDAKVSSYELKGELHETIEPNVRLPISEVVELDEKSVPALQSEDVPTGFSDPPAGTHFADSVEPSLLIREVDAKVNELIAEFSMDKTVRDYGIKSVEAKLGTKPSKSDDSINPEPAPVQHLRQYSNYMTPNVGFASADSWAFVGLYLRNLFANWMIFMPVLIAILLVPRLLFSLLRESSELISTVCNSISMTSSEMHNSVFFAVGSAILVTGIFLVIWSIRFVLENLPSKNLRRRKKAGANDANVLVNCVLPISVSGFILTTLWWGAGFHYSESIPDNLLRGVWTPRPVYYVAISLATYFIAFLFFSISRLFRSISLDLNPGAMFAGLVSAITGGLLLWFCSFYWGIDRDHSLVFLVFATPAFIVSFLIQTTVFVMFSSKTTPDADREWYARLGGWLLVAACGWIVVNVLVLFGVEITQWLYNTIRDYFMGDVVSWPAWLGALVTPIVTALTAATALAGGFSSATSAISSRLGTGRPKSFQIVVQVTSILSVLVLLITLSYLSAVVLSKTASFLYDYEFFRSIPFLVSWYVPEYRGLRHIDTFTKMSTFYLLAWFVVLTLFGILVSCVVNVNTFSLHSAYRDRLVRAYLGASNAYRHADEFTGFCEKDNRQMHRLRFQRPLHIINATLNLINGTNLAWQNRKAASFTLSPLFCGNWSFGFRRTNEYSTIPNRDGCKHLRYCNRSHDRCKSLDECSKTKSLRLGTAMAISGAAANPNMGHYSSPVVTFLLGIFNVRLGWWLGNPGNAGNGLDFWRRLSPAKSRRFYQRSSPAFAMLPLINEVLGRTSEDKRYVNVTDGGHFENLAIYEMVLRRSRLIIVSDAAADVTFKFSEISNAIEKCRVDLGVEIKFRTKFNIHSRNVTEEVRKHGQRYALADIIYPERNGHGQRRRGYLIYLRPTLSGKEPIEISHYADSNASFPHQSTGDQFFDEAQFEAYRELGALTMEEVIRADDVKDILSRFI